MKKIKITVPILIAIAIAVILFPLLFLKGAEFGGSDGMGSEMVHEVAGDGFEPWFAPVAEKLTGGEMSPEIETLIFCIQTGIGVGILAFCFGYLAARKKYGGDAADDSDTVGEGEDQS